MPSLPGVPGGDRASRSGRCGQSRCSRRMAIGRCRGAFRIDDCRRGSRGSARSRAGAARRRGRLDGAGRIGQQVRPPEARVPAAALRVQDLEVRPPARRAVAVAGDGHGAALADHVPAQPDPAGPRQLQPQAARLLDGGRQSPAERVRLDHDEQRPRAPRQRREPAQPVPDAHPADRRIAAVGQVDDEQVHGPGREERGREREGLLEVDGREHDEPLGADPRGSRPRRDRRRGRGRARRRSRPSAWASAARRSARVVLPDEASPRSATVVVRGSPPVPRMASRAANPVGTTRPSASGIGCAGRGVAAGAPVGSGTSPGSGSASPGSRSSGSSSGIGARARAPSTMSPQVPTPPRSSPNPSEPGASRAPRRRRMSEPSDDRY